MRPEGFHRRARRLHSDLMTAALCFDTAWYGNSCEELHKALSPSYSRHVYDLLFHSVMLRSVASLLRCIDRQKNAATIDTFLKDAQTKPILDIIVSDAAKWPMYDGRKGKMAARKKIERLLTEIRIDYFLIYRYENDLFGFRNRELSHSAIQMSQSKMNYNKLCQCVRLGENIAFNVLLISEGCHQDPRDQRDVQALYTRHFFRALASGLEAGSEDSYDPSWGPIQCVSGDS